MQKAITLDVKVGTSKFGKGLFSKRGFKKGELIFIFTGNEISFNETIKMGELECYTIQIDDKLYIIPEEPYCYINHSCDPNCGMNGKLELVAIKDIEVNEELFFDYSTTMLERHWQMECLCDSPKCRKTIMDFDFLPHNTRNKYIELNVVQPFILKYLSEKYS